MKGKLVFGFTGTTGTIPCIYKDRGWYEGTRQEYNVRKVSEIERFERLDGEKVMRALCGKDAQAYGCRWGGGMDRLYLVTATTEGIRALKALDNAERERKAKAQEEAEAEKYQHYRRLSDSGICPKCGTWCYGDCES